MFHVRCFRSDVLLKVVGLFLLLSGSTPAQPHDIQVSSSPVFFDRPEFDSLVLVEFPFSVARQDFEFYQPDSTSGMLFTKVFAFLNVYDTEGMPFDSASTYFTAAVPDLIEAARPGIRLFNSIALVLPAGVYSGRLKVIDGVSKAEGEIFFDRISVEVPYKERLSIGGECLAYRIAYVGGTENTSTELRNGYEVYCNPTGVFSTDDSVAFVYAEIYNLTYEEGKSTKFKTTWSVQAGGLQWRSLGQETKPTPGRSAVVTHRFDISDWIAGSYLLRLKIEDDANGTIIAREWPLRIVKPQSALAYDNVDLLDDPGDTLSMEVQGRLIYYLLNPEEKLTWDRLNEEGRKSFMRQFWADRDSDPTTRVNEFRLQILDRYLFANLYFSTEVGADDGWFSDRGRILMKYGTWDRRLDRFSNMGYYPYELWYYDRLANEGGVFVFVDEDNINDFRLVHSNVDGEIWSSDWEEILRSSGLER